MAPWPPSPSVEDESTALANEHSIDASIDVLKSEDQPALDRGSIDQYPVIIDSPDHTGLGKVEDKNTPIPEALVTDISSSDDSAGPSTPPPLFRKEQKQPSNGPSNNTSEWSGAKTNPSTPTNVQREPPNRARPQITRIQTDVGADIASLATGNRRPPSPYSYTRTPTFPGMSGMDSVLSPAHAAASPNAFANQYRQTPTMTFSAADHLGVPSNNAVVDSPQHSRPRSQYGGSQPGQPREHNSAYPTSWVGSGAPYRPSQDARRQSYHEEPKRLSVEYAPLSPPHSRRPSKESGWGSSSDDRPRRPSPPYSRRGTQDYRNSPQTSSAEESSRSHGRRSERSSGRSERGSGEERQKARRRSSHHHERPILVDSRKNSTTESQPSSAVGGPQSRYYRYDPRNEHQLYPITPNTSDHRNAAATAEDIFAKAFRDNASRTRKERSPRSSGSALASPMSSPPRTPKSERQSKDYFDMTPTLQRPAQRSRPPSMDEGQVSRTHSTLLSAATAGAALAARASNATTRSSGQSTETSSSSATSKAPSAPRSRKPSPVPEDAQVQTKVAVHSPVDHHLIPSATLLPTHDGRPISRGSTAVSDSTQHHPHPHRALSYSGPDHTYHPSNSNPTSATSPTYNVSITMPGAENFAPQPRSARSSVYPAEVSSLAKDMTGLPICPRSQPTIGYRDWHTIKEISDIDICPTCMSVVGNTRYRDLFVKSLPRPYNEPSVCVMSKPWVRIAFMQALKQNEPDLRFVRVAATLPKDTKACAGGKTDVRAWFRVTDPQTKEFIPDFQACSACIRIVDRIFYPVCKVFVRPNPNLCQERSCSLHINSKHFHSLTEELDQASVRCKGRSAPRSADIEPLIRHFRRVARYQPCPRDEMQANRAWHIIPQLPEFTVCEECYDEVVWPVSERYIARDITKTLKTIPQTRSNASQSGNSCQLYSDRMRRIFLDAVNRRDFTSLKEAVQTRANHQNRLHEMNKLYEQDMRFGIDRRSELERNRHIWRTIE